MELKTRRINGNIFTAEDILEVTLNTYNQPMAQVDHTIELVSGVGVTHGGGGLPDEYLHYKSAERDSDADGIVDYSSIQMHLSQVEQGTSVIRVLCRAFSVEDMNTFKAAHELHRNAALAAGYSSTDHPQGTDGTFTALPPKLTPTILKTGEITLEWSDDSFV